MTEVERSGMGFAFNDDRRQAEVANGALGGYDGQIDRSNGMASEHISLANIDPLQAHLQDVRYEIASVTGNPNPSAAEHMEFASLQTDEIVLSSLVDAVEFVQANPLDTKRFLGELCDRDAEIMSYLTHRLFDHVQETGDLEVLPVDVLHEESEVLSELIADADNKPAGVIAVAETLKDFMDAGAGHPDAAVAVMPKELAQAIAV